MQVTRIRRISGVREVLYYVENESSSAGRSLFRALLRECTYLPDPDAKSFLTKLIVERWRRYHMKTIDPGRKEVVNYEALRALRLLRRANHGQLGPLSKVMLLTYGRVGKRRHELLESFKLIDRTPKKSPFAVQSNKVTPGLGQPSLQDSDFISTSLKGVEIHPEVLQKLPRITPQFLAVLKSQKNLKQIYPYKRLLNLKLAKPEVAPTNLWGLPMPQKRIKNKVKDWYAEMLSKLMPPLPEKEWYRLQSKALGHIQLSAIPRRSKGIVSLKYKEKGTALERALSAEKEILEPQREHHITGKFMKRMCRAIFEICPLLIWSTHQKKWSVSWGAVPRPSTSLEERQTRLGAGLDQQIKEIESTIEMSNS